MSDLMRQLELRLKNQLDKAQQRLQDAPADAEVRRQYRQALRTFSRLVLDGILPED